MTPTPTNVGAGRRFLSRLAAAVAAPIAIWALAGCAASSNAAPAVIVQPAVFAGRAVAAHVAVRPHSFGIDVRMTPNRARVRNALQVHLTDHGMPVNGARVSATFSMPVMNMWHVLTTALIPSGEGTYGATEPVLGMAGVWQIVIRASRPHAPTLSFTADARMHA